MRSNDCLSGSRNGTRTPDSSKKDVHRASTQSAAPLLYSMCRCLPPVPPDSGATMTLAIFLSDVNPNT